VLNHRPALLISLAAAALLLGCNDPAGKPGGALVPAADQTARPAAPDLAAALPVPPPPQPAAPEASAVKVPSLYVRSSRCGECHEKMRSEWLGSAHAKSSHSPAYRKSLALAPPALRGLCASCHLPSQAAGQPDDEPGRPSEGVSCDGCHTLSAVQLQKTAAAMTFDPSSGKKYGPILGASGHYFHDMAYSPLHTKSEFCAGCHHLTTFKLGGSERAIPVVTDYADWQRLGIKKACQDCHMPSRGSEPVARGSKPRPNVPSHAFPGAVALAKSLRFELSAHSKPGEVAVEIQHSAGHMLPSGFVDRRLILRAEWQAADGSKLGSEERVYGILLTNEAGQPAPFFQATQVKQDHRLAPNKLYVESFRIPPAGPAAAPPAGAAPVKLVLSLLAAPTAPDLSAVYGEPELTLLRSVSANLPLRPGGK
jgi:hypothetical protein